MDEDEVNMAAELIKQMTRLADAIESEKREQKTFEEAFKDQLKVNEANSLIQLYQASLTRIAQDYIKGDIGLDKALSKMKDLKQDIDSYELYDDEGSTEVSKMRG